MYAPVEDIIPREPQPEVKGLMDKLNRLMENFVDFGSNVLKWDTEVKRTEAYNTTIIMSYRHFLELADSISILIKQSSIDPCKLLLRGMLETYFNVAYMLEKDTDKRGMSFLVWHIHKQIKAHKKSDPNSEMGKQFAKTVSTDKLVGNIKLPETPEAAAKITALETLLSKPPYEEAEQEYQRLRASGNKNPSWYNFYGGPDKVEKLAKHLELSALYEVAYRRWSDPIHGTDIIVGKASVAADGSAEIFQLRHFGDVQEIAQWTLTLSLKMFELYIKERLPEKQIEYGKWYLTIRDPFLRISSREPLIVVK